MEGRSEPQSLTPDPVDPVDPLDPVDPVVNSEWRVLGMKKNEHQNQISTNQILSFKTTYIKTTTCKLSNVKSVFVKKQ